MVVNMKKAIPFFMVMILIFQMGVSAKKTVDIFEKYEVVSLPEKAVVGVDAENLIAYCNTQGEIGAYAVDRDEKLFDFEDDWGAVSPFFQDETAVVSDKEGMAIAIINKKGKKICRLPSGYIYSREFSNGLICLIDSTLQENVYTLFNRKGKPVIEHFFEVKAELPGGDILVMNAGGGYLLVSKDGKAVQLPCIIRISYKDGISPDGKTYVGQGGKVYTIKGKEIFSDEDLHFLAPLTDKKVIGVEKNGDTTEIFIIDIKSKEKTVLNIPGIKGDFAYASSNISGDSVFITTISGTYLVNIKDGSVLSEKIENCGNFYEGINRVQTTRDGKTYYRLMNNKGEYLKGEFVFATDMNNGYAVISESNEEAAAIYLMFANGNKELIYQGKSYELVKSLHNKAVFVSENIGDKEEKTLVAQKTQNGNIYVNDSLGRGEIYKFKDESAQIKHIVLGISALALIVIFFAVRQKNKKED